MRASTRRLPRSGLLGVVLAHALIGACGPLVDYGDNYYAVTFKNETSRTLVMFDGQDRTGRKQVATPGGSILRGGYSGAYSGALKVELWNEDLTPYYCGMFARSDFAKLQYKVVITGPRSDR